MGYNYSELVDRAKIQKIIGTNYLNAAKFVNSGLIRYEGDISQGTTEEWIRSEIFEGNPDGQAMGVNSELSLESESQTLYKMPVCWRGNGVLVDKIYNEIKAKAAQEAEVNVTNGVSRNSAQIVDGVMVAILNGAISYLVTNDTNYSDQNGSQISPTILQEAKAERADMGDMNSIMVCRSRMYFKLGALGMAAYTANTLGAQAQDSLIRTGNVVNDSYLGMTVLMTDKLKDQAGGTTVGTSNDHYIFLTEANAFVGKRGSNPEIEPIQRQSRKVQEEIIFTIKAGGTLSGLSWNGSVNSDGSITNSDLETSTNWTSAVKSGNEKFIKGTVIRVDNPSF